MENDSIFQNLKKNIIFFVHFRVFSIFLAPFFLWILAGWYTLHCLWNILYIFYHSHIHWISLQLLYMYTCVPKSSWTLTHSCYPLLYIYPSNHFLPLKQSSWNLSRYLDLEKSRLKNFTGTWDWTRSATPNHAFDAYTVE